MTLLQAEALIAFIVALGFIFWGLDDYLTADRYQAEKKAMAHLPKETLRW